MTYSGGRGRHENPGWVRRSTSAKEALKLARKHALAFKGSVDIVTSMERGTEQEQQAIEDAERGLEWAKTMFTDKELDCRTHLLIRGLAPGEDILEFAKESKWTKSLSALNAAPRLESFSWIDGPVVILQAPCPVVTVK